MPPPTRHKPDRAATVLTRWRGMGAMLAVAFYSLFFAAHLKFNETALYVRDGLILGARGQTVFNDLTTDIGDDHTGISPMHPAFTLLHQPVAQLLIKGWSALGNDPSNARKHSVAALTCLAGALAVVMIYHTLLWAGSTTFRSILVAAIFGASTCVWMVAPLPEIWIFVGLGIVGLIAVTARGSLVHPLWHLLATVYAISTFAGSLIPCLIMALTRCAQERAQSEHYRPQPILITLIAITISFGLANVQREIFPHSAPLPKTWQECRALNSGWQATPETMTLVAREVFLTNIVAPAPVSTPAETTLNLPLPSKQQLHRGVSGGWLLIIALAFTGLIWRARLEPLMLGTATVLMWSIAALACYGQPETLLLHASLWTGLIVIVTGLGLERALTHWSWLTKPVTLMLMLFVSAQLVWNWLYIQDVAALARQ